jgi:zinc transporter ZupT
MFVARQFMRPVTTPLLAVLLVVALVVGALGGYFVASRLNNNQVSQSAFVPYSDNYGGHIDDS